VAVKTFTLTDTNNGLNAALLADGVDQTAATRSTGKWTVAKVAAGNSSNYSAPGIQASTSFDLDSTNPKPVTGLANSGTFIIPAVLTGTFAATAWTSTFAVRATTVSAQAGRVRMRVWKNTAATVSSATELTGAILVGTTSAALSTTVDVTSVVTWSPGAFALAAEYLIVSLAWEITTAGGSNNADVIFRTGQASGGTRIVTPDLSAGGAEVIPDVGMALTVS